MTRARRLRIGSTVVSLAMVLAFLAAVAGLLVPGLYRDAPAWIQQAQGADLATLVLATPTFLIGSGSLVALTRGLLS